MWCIMINMISIYSGLADIRKELLLSRLIPLGLFIMFVTVALWCSFTVSSFHLGLIVPDQVSGGLALLGLFDPLKEAVVMDGATIILRLIAMMIVIAMVLVNVQRDGSTHSGRLVFVEWESVRFSDFILQAFRRGILHAQIY